MATRRIQQIVTDDLSKLNPGQVGYSSVADDVTGKRSFGGKNDADEVAVFLEKDQNIRTKNVLAYNVNTASVSASPITLNALALDTVPSFSPVVSAVSKYGTSNPYGYDPYAGPYILQDPKVFQMGFNFLNYTTGNEGFSFKLMTQDGSGVGSYLGMTRNKVVVNAVDTSSLKDVLAESTFSCLTLVYDSRNDALGSSPNVGLYHWNLGVASNSDLVFQPENISGEDGRFRITSAGNMSVGSITDPHINVYAKSVGYDSEVVFGIPVLTTSATSSTHLNKLNASMFVLNQNPNTLYIRVKGDDGNLRIGSIPLST